MSEYAKNIQTIEDMWRKRIELRSETTTAWGGWPIINQRCYKCAHCGFAYGTPACHCASRTVVHGFCGDTCASYLVVGE